ncbi:Hypothetical protein ORPV_859 [Orpheovirus IHUMI-LCC2]|uniref:Uncharacterized protein n=1 Tax=Orpheovirus IHUMI-LCC2 TaxID=2023057 RepID=A0A2I2L5F1_9VIRU|nr:Hypothetical protein ORPV_859 [Orpheovirus IHUMI-LCC2]SNW62763.1 Hypothetical protein ORPV_859 [Orpheovirus IHUMI-LCC2]
MQSLQCHALLNYVSSCDNEEELKSLKEKISERTKKIKLKKLLNNLFPDGDTHNELFKSKIISLSRRKEYMSFQPGHYVSIYNILLCEGHMITLTCDTFQSVNLISLDSSSIKNTLGDVRSGRTGVYDDNYIHVIDLNTKKVLNFLSNLGLENNKIYVEKLRCLLQEHIKKYLNFTLQIHTEDTYIKLYRSHES